MTLSIRSIAIAVLSLAAAAPVWSQVPVVDLSNEPPPRQVSASQPANRAQTNPQAEVYYQMQMLQREVQQLRGGVEELKHEVKRLRQQRSEDYMDLDRRLVRIAGGEPADTTEDPSSQPASIPAENPAADSEGESERDRYQASFALARSGDYTGAQKAFKDFLEAYPRGQFAPNANYWLGEIALVQGNIEEAREWFLALLDGYPKSNKVWDTRYKLGTVYHQLGEQTKAKGLLQQVASSDARAAKLAKRYLQENF